MSKIVINFPTNNFPLLIDEATAKIYTNLTGFAQIRKNGQIATLPLRVIPGDYLIFTGTAGTNVTLQ